MSSVPAAGPAARLQHGKQESHLTYHVKHVTTVDWEQWWGFVDKSKNKSSYLAVFQIENQMLIGNLVTLIREKKFVTYLGSWRHAAWCLHLFNLTAPSCFSSLPGWIKLLPDILQIDPLSRNAEHDCCFDVKKHFWYMPAVLTQGTHCIHCQAYFKIKVNSCCNS